MKKLLLLLLFGTMAYAQPAINAPVDIANCDDSYDSYTFFDLTSNTIVMLAGQDPTLFNITYHSTQLSAEDGENPISDPNNYFSYTSTVYTRVTEIANPANYITAAFNLTVLPRPAVPYIPTQYATDTNDEDEMAVFDLTILNSIVLNGASPSEFSVIYYPTLSDAEFGVNPMANPESYFAITSTVYARIQNNATGCYAFADVSLVVLPEDFVTPAPTGESTYGYELGDTLADIPLQGENIQWYETETGDTPLPMTTELANNVTYYATQTIANQESTERLAVMTYSILMGVDQNKFNHLSYYPNPATNILNIENTNGIDTVSIANALGQAVMTQTINNSTAQVDVSSLGNGIYFATIRSGSAVKTIKIIKD